MRLYVIRSLRFANGRRALNAWRSAQLHAQLALRRLRFAISEWRGEALRSSWVLWQRSLERLAYA